MQAPMADLTGATMPPTPELPVPLPSWLTSNQYFTAGFGLMGMGMAASLLRGSTTSLEAVLRRQCLMSLEIPSRDRSYQWVMQWMVAKGVHGSKHLGVETSYIKDAAGNASASFSYVPSPGRHWCSYRGTFLHIERRREAKTVDISTGTPWETLTLTTFSWQPKLFEMLLQEAKEAAIEKEEGKTILYQVYGPEWRPFGDPKRVRPFDSVILDGDAAEYILGDVHEFLNTQSWYLDRGIPYRRGYLLYGPPGCGKSSYVMALAGKLGYNIAMLNLGDPAMTDDRLQHLLAMVPPRCLVLLEDVDFAVSPREPPATSGPYAGVTRTTFSGLLNALDGVVATEERIVFMTTNHYRALPRALVRPGRVDVRVYVGVASRDQLKKMFLRFYPGEETMADNFATVCDGENLSMAEIQGFVLFFKKDPARCLAEVQPMLDARRKHFQEHTQASAASQVDGAISMDSHSKVAVMPTAE